MIPFHGNILTLLLQQMVNFSLTNRAKAYGALIQGGDFPRHIPHQAIFAEAMQQSQVMPQFTA
jgi:hypothetical protein